MPFPYSSNISSNISRLLVFTVAVLFRSTASLFGVITITILSLFITKTREHACTCAVNIVEHQQSLSPWVRRSLRSSFGTSRSSLDAPFFPSLGAPSGYRLSLSHDHCRALFLVPRCSLLGSFSTQSASSPGAPSRSSFSAPSRSSFSAPSRSSFSAPSRSSFSAPSRYHSAPPPASCSSLAPIPLIICAPSLSSLPYLFVAINITHFSALPAHR
jgi:hypothetical protein